MKIISIAFAIAALLGATANAAPSGFSTIATATVDTAKISLQRSINLSDQRTNGDGNVFYRTTFKVKLDDRGTVTEKTLDTDLYTPQDLAYNGDGMRPTFLIDPSAKVLTIFATGKGPNNSDYDMVGYTYRLDSGKVWKREAVFSQANYGWYSYFGGSNDGNPELFHFSYDGYRQYRSLRDQNGQWQNIDIGRIRPDMAVAELKSKKNILVSTAWGDQSPSTHTPTRSDAISGEAVGSLIAGAVLIGAVKWLLEPPRGGNSYPAADNSGKRAFSCSFICRGSMYMTGARHSVDAWGSGETAARESVKSQAENLCMSENRHRSGGWWADMSICQAK